jgi:hypothetical protein
MTRPVSAACRRRFPCRSGVDFADAQDSGRSWVLARSRFGRAIHNLFPVELLRTGISLLSAIQSLLLRSDEAEERGIAPVLGFRPFPSSRRTPFR